MHIAEIEIDLSKTFRGVRMQKQSFKKKKFGVFFQLLSISYLAFLLVALGSSSTAAYFLSESETFGESISATSLFTVENKEEAHDAVMKDEVESNTGGYEELFKDKEAPGNEINENIGLKEFSERNESTDSKVENEKEDSKQQIDK